MKITDLLSSKSLLLNASAVNKEDAINQAIDLISKNGMINDVNAYRKGVFAREEESTTGIGEGIAIPHAKSDSVTKPCLAALVFKNGVDFNSLDGEKVNLLFLIAAPNNEDNVHLDVLARLSNLLMNEDFKNKLIKAKSKKEFLSVLDNAENDKLNETDVDSNYYDIVAVTACPTGIAHTYMAEQALKDKAKELGYSIKVETNGSGGIKNKLTEEEISYSKGVIVACDTTVEMDRFDGKPLLQVAVAKGIHEPEKLIKQIMEGETPIYKAKEKYHQKEEKDGSFFHNIYKHLMSGVSHMLPFVIGGGILIALAFLIDSIAGVPTDSNFGTGTPISWFLKNLGGYAFNFMLPILSSYIAYSISGRPGLAVGLVGGYLATISSFSIEVQLSGNDTGSSAGFIGALLAGFIAGYIILFLEKITLFLPKSLDGVKPTLIYPLLGILLIGVAMFLLNTPFTYINIGISNGLNWLGENNLTIVLGGLLALMMATDMGGPINKASYVFGTGLLTAAASSSDVNFQNYCYQMMAAVMIGGMVPPLGIALSSTLFPQKYTKNERKDALVNYIMGLSFITEGAIPYAAKDPWRVILSSAIGSLVAGLLSVSLGCTLMAPHGGIFVFAVVGNWYFYLLALLIGSFVSCVLLGILKKDENNPELGDFKGLKFRKGR